ncbi:hypothetical protein NDN08_000458 [Rhodosorus marinus]|uniref:Uncharacterized protein n=1 Tax=Rhodosorus marinus TaxID=101924 RepID=A0AAV8US20_9RHOD|nr:hypothetical protein NDN08_000458 [Rhodosorus marinus]
MEKNVDGIVRTRSAAFVCKFSREPTRLGQRELRTVSKIKVRARIDCQSAVTVGFCKTSNIIYLYLRIEVIFQNGQLRELDDRSLEESRHHRPKKGLLRRVFGAIPTNLVKGWYVIKANLRHSGHHMPLGFNAMELQYGLPRESASPSISSRKGGPRIRFHWRADKEALLAYATQFGKEVLVNITNLEETFRNRTTADALEGNDTSEESEQGTELKRRKSPLMEVGRKGKKPEV